MKKLTTKKDQAKRAKRNQFLLGGFLILIMFGSVFGIIVNSFRDDEENGIREVTYNGFEFVNQNGFWVSDIGSFQFLFSNNPAEIKFNESVNISEDISPLNQYSGQPLYVLSEDENAKWELYRNLHPDFNQIVQRMQGACLEECEGDLPVKTCENNFIIIRESNESRIIQEDNCVFIDGERENLIKLVDKYLFKVLGIE
ncbi:hypothetical protein GOV13_01795 [Candidatus Pacearchaeota archaeon]|nr:hypothetical protein [Candidatus Pacearchaeota archaeon]